jgi:TP901 family phage tail tape measure protein
MAVLKSLLILSLIDNVSGPARRISGVMAGFQKQQLGMLSALRGAGGLLALGAGYLGVTQGIGATAGAAVEFEEAFANVRKVLNGSDEQLENIRRSIIGMSKDLPIAASGIAEIYAAAGQANIPIQEMNKFVEMVAKVSTAWDVPVAETGDALAKIKTQLNLGVAEVGLFADSLNHLANNTAANAPNLLEYTSRVAATGEMFGFSAQETLAFGGAMISAGAESEVAATSFRNMGRALTKGTEATKMQRTAYKRLGLDAVKTAKNMQKNALGTTLDVIEKIQELPEWERISMASALFGDEARALMPAINNSTELRRQLGLVGDQANYAGSAFNEYIIRANTTGNVLQILRNKFADLFRGIGDNMLPGIKEAALGVGDIIDSLGERAHVFSQMEAAFKGFAQGMGAEGGIRDMINDLGDLLFGAADGSAAADKIGRIFVKFKEWGAAVRELTTAIAANPLVKFFADLAPYGFQIMLWGAGIAMLAGTIRKLAAALMFLSGASTILAALKAVGSIAAIVGGGAAAGGAPKGGPTTPGGPGSPKAGGSIWSTLKGLSAAALALGVVTTLGGNGEVTQLTPEQRNMMFNKRGQSPVTPTIPGISAFTALDNATHARAMGFGGSTENQPGKTKDDIDIGVLRAAMAPQGVQQVMVTNPQAPNVTVHAPITITGVADGSAAGSAAASQLGNEVKSAVESGYMDSR